MKSNLAGLYIQIEAKKRRIKIINGGNPPKTGGTEGVARALPPGNLSRKRYTVCCNPTVKQRKAKLAVRDCSNHEIACSLAGNVQIKAVYEENCTSGRKTNSLVPVHKSVIVDQ
jgi:hypothetical protein